MTMHRDTSFFKKKGATLMHRFWYVRFIFASEHIGLLCLVTSKGKDYLTKNPPMAVYPYQHRDIRHDLWI